MSQEAHEAKLVEKTLSVLRMARQVIDKFHRDKDEGFQEEPSLSDLVLVAQILGQTSMFDRIGEGVLPDGAEAPGGTRQALSGPAALPDIFVIWTPEGWYVDAHPDFHANPQQCRDKQELLATLKGMADICATNRLS